eukprot:jgi/Mesvir1/24033/Mv10771-RA.1
MAAFLPIDKATETALVPVGQYMLLFSLCFCLCRLLLRERSHGFVNRVVSIIHAIISCVLACLSVEDWSDLFGGIGGPNNAAQLLCMQVSLGYFIYDFVCCFFETPLDMITQVHHVLAIAGLAYGVTHGKSGSELVLCLAVIEVSNPMMHTRWCLRELGRKTTPLALANEMLFVLLYFVGRIVIGPMIVYHCVLSETIHIVVKIGAIGIQLVSLFWFYKILCVAIRKFSPDKKGKAKEM